MTDFGYAFKASNGDMRVCGMTTDLADALAALKNTLAPERGAAARPMRLFMSRDAMAHFGLKDGQLDPVFGIAIVTETKPFRQTKAASKRRKSHVHS